MIIKNYTNWYCWDEGIFENVGNLLGIYADKVLSVKNIQIYWT